MAAADEFKITQRSEEKWVKGAWGHQHSEDESAKETERDTKLRDSRKRPTRSKLQGGESGPEI